MSAKDRDHAKFIKNLDDSDESVWIAAMHLNQMGVPVTVRTHTKSESYDDRLNHLDQGDLEIVQRVEVKGLSTEFTCKDDFPFKSIIVCAKHSWDFANPKPYAYMLLNKNRTHYGLIKGETRESWFVDSFKDKRYESMVQECYKTNLDNVTFGEINIYD